MSRITNIVFIFSIASIQNICAIDPYPDAVVSLWRLDRKGSIQKDFLCIAAIIKPNCILMKENFLKKIRPLKTIGLITGRNYDVSKKMENSVIKEELSIPGDNKYHVLVVVPSFELRMPYILSEDIYCDKPAENGFLIGWNIQTGPKKQAVTFNRPEKRITLLPENKLSSAHNYPPSAFLVKGNSIIGISNVIVRSTGVFTEAYFTQTLYAAMMFKDLEERQETVPGDLYVDALVSFWRLSSRRKREKLLLVGALIESNWILVHRDSLQMLENPMSIGIDTGRKFSNDGVDSDSTNFIDFKILKLVEIPENERLIIIVMEPGIRLPLPYTVINTDTCFKNSYNGELIGLRKTGEPNKMAGELIFFQGSYIPIVRDHSNVLENFGLGSFLVCGRNIIAVSHGTNQGEHVFTILTNIDSVQISRLIESKADLD